MGELNGRGIGKKEGASADDIAGCDVTGEKIDKLNNMFAPSLWLEQLPSQQGTVLAALLANIMTAGLTPNQENILGNFISSLGALISYKASRDDLSPNVLP